MWGGDRQDGGNFICPLIPAASQVFRAALGVLRPCSAPAQGASALQDARLSLRAGLGAIAALVSTSCSRVSTAKQLDGTELSQGIEAKASGLRDGMRSPLSCACAQFTRRFKALLGQRPADPARAKPPLQARRRRPATAPWAGRDGTDAAPAAPARFVSCREAEVVYFETNHRCDAVRCGAIHAMRAATSPQPRKFPPERQRQLARSSAPQNVAAAPRPKIRKRERNKKREESLEPSLENCLLS